jgi:hypothetical protein
MGGKYHLPLPLADVMFEILPTDSLKENTAITL